SGQEVGIIDVPGHERFVKNMLAGVGGIDLALLIVAADEGIMPQTKEHLAILDLLKVQKGIVVITKKDTVDDEILGVVRMEVEEAIKDTTLAGSPLVAVSALTGVGLPELKETIDKILASAQPKKDIGRPRLPIDRIFTIAGSGTIVTGTLIDGSLEVGQEVEIVPSGLKSRVRGLQTHKAKVTTASPGSRVAANLVGINTIEVQRGDVLTRPGWLVPTPMLTVKLRLLPYIRHPLRHNANVNFYTGAAEVMAKVRLLEADEVKPGSVTWAQIVLNRPTAVVNGDRFIIRSTMETLGGGDVIDAHAKRLRRHRPDVIKSLEAREGGSAEDNLLALLEAKQPLDLPALSAQYDLPVDKARAMVSSLIEQGMIVSAGQGERSLLFTAAGWERLAKKAMSLVQDYHQKYPARAGMPGVELGSRLKLGAFVSAILQKLAAQGVIVEEGTTVRLPGHQIRLTKEQQSRIDAFLKSLLQEPYSPPTELIPEPDLLNLLIEQRKVVKVAEGLIFATSAYNEMVGKVTAYVKAHGKITVAEVRDLLKTSRKYALPFLEHLDQRKITRRVGDERVLY
ncbi:MAG: selenocysteine-specific translation elongation factor, partial [Dehalococcoidales bacterium]|nr:selenocysteine-specific translation elongation factor [Dehalococcoidales bacterium]